MTTLTLASKQWMTRPADERYDSLDALHAAVLHHRNVAAEQRAVPLSRLQIVARADDAGVLRPVLGSKANTDMAADFTHYSFGQFCRRLATGDRPVPAGYLRTLPAELAATNLNHALTRAVDDTDVEEREGTLLFAQNGRLVLRAITSDRYTRIWNSDVTRRLLQFTALNPIWQPAPAGFDGSRGLYASDKDMFAFLVDNDRRIFETLPGGGFSRGFFVWNSEVGDAAFNIMTFLYQYICGNHMVWGASGVTHVRIPHIGNADERAFGKIAVELRKYHDASAEDEEAKISAMIRKEIAGTKDEILDALFGLNVTRKVAARAVEIAEQSEDRYGNPRSVFAIVSGITEQARDKANADERVALEVQAGKVAQIAFA